MMDDLILLKMREGDWGAVVKLMQEERLRSGGNVTNEHRERERSRNFSVRFVSSRTTPRRIANGVVEDNGKFRGIVIGGREYKPTTRFTKGLAQRMKVPLAVFDLFSPLEVVKRAAEVAPDMELRITVDDDEGKALALIEDKGHPIPAGAVEAVMKNDPRLAKFEYREGVISGIFDLKETWEIPKDSAYRLRVRTEVPVDGMGTPHATLGLMRLICTNGAVAEAASFRTKMEVKDNSGAHFERLLKSFNNPQGVEMLHERLLAAIETKASVREVLVVDDFLRRQVRNAEDSMRLRERLQDVAGNPCVRYGVTDIATIGVRRRTLLPVDCSVADVINFVTELKTHHAHVLKNVDAADGLVGDFYALGYDLEEMYVNAQPSAAFSLKGINLHERVDR